MDIILYAMPDSSSAQVLEDTLQKTFFPIVLKRFDTLQRFIQYAIEHRGKEQIIIIVIEKLREFLDLHSLFNNDNLENLIIICDDSEDMIKLAHEFRPRFLAHENEVDKVIAVVEKMMQVAKSI